MGGGSSKSLEKYRAWPKRFHLCSHFYSPGRAPAAVPIFSRGDARNFSAVADDSNMELRYTRFFYKEPSSRPSSKSSLFLTSFLPNFSTKSS